MNVVQKSIEFKSKHPTNYWLRTLCFAFCLVFVSLWAIGEAEGVPVESTFNETNTYWNDFSGNQKFTHTKDDYIVVQYCDDDGDVMIAYRRPEGFWNYAEVSPYDFAGATQWKLGGIINTDNNSLVMLASGQIGSYYTAYLFTKFADSDWNEWESLIFLSQGSVSFYQGDIAINDTGIILATCRKSSGNWWTYRLLDFSEWPVLSGGITGISWNAGAGSSMGFQIEANTTGSFHMMWKSTDNKMHIQDLEKNTPSMIIQDDTKYFPTTFGWLDNGVLCVGGLYAYSTTKFPCYWYQSVPEGAFTKIRLDPLSGKDYNYYTQVVLRTGSTIPVIITYHETDEYLVTYGANWDASEATWQSSAHDTGLTSADEILTLGASNSLWPSHPSSGINWTRLTAGWCILAQDDDPDPNAWKLIQSNWNWSADLTTFDPEITTVALDNAVYDVFYSFTLEKANGTTPFGWTLLIGPGWMLLGPLNGTLYGTPDGTGTEQVRVKLNDAVPRYDERQWTLTIGAASEGGEGGDTGPDPASGICSSGWIAFVVIFLMLFVLVGVTANNML